MTGKTTLKRKRQYCLLRKAGKKTPNHVLRKEIVLNTGKTTILYFLCILYLLNKCARIEMTEYQCSCHINTKSYSLLTCGASTVTQAMQDFKHYVDSKFPDKEHSMFEQADGLIIDKVDVPA